MLILFTVGSILCIILSVVTYLTIEELTHEVKKKEWAEVGLSVIMLTMYLFLAYFIASSLHSAWILGEF